MVQLLVVAFLLVGNLAAANGKPAEARNEDVPKGPASAPTVTKPQGGQQSPTGSTGSKGTDTKGAPAPGGGTTNGAGKGGSPGK